MFKIACHNFNHPSSWMPHAYSLFYSFILLLFHRWIKLQKIMLWISIETLYATFLLCATQRFVWHPNIIDIDELSQSSMKMITEMMNESFDLTRLLTTMSENRFFLTLRYLYHEILSTQKAQPFISAKTLFHSFRNSRNSFETSLKFKNVIKCYGRAPGVVSIFKRNSHLGLGSDWRGSLGFGSIGSRSLPCVNRWD